MAYKTGIVLLAHGAAIRDTNFENFQIGPVEGVQELFERESILTPGSKTRADLSDGFNFRFSISFYFPPGSPRYPSIANMKRDWEPCLRIIWSRADLFFFP